MSNPKKPRPRMSLEDRAKQFMPFAALKGYEEALRAEEARIEAMSGERKVTDLSDISDEAADIP